MIDCLRDECSGTLQDFDSIKVSLPTPSSEVVYGGKSPNYSTEVNLPIKYCDECRQVFFSEEDENK